MEDMKPLRKPSRFRILNPLNREHHELQAKYERLQIEYQNLKLLYDEQQVVIANLLEHEKK